MSHRFGYGMAMAIFAGIVLAVGAVVIAVGPEAHRVSFGEKADSSA
jgi:hypothetical protein